MQVYFVGTADDTAVAEHEVADLPSLRGREDGFVWVDVPRWEAEVGPVLSEQFGCHRLVVEAFRRRNHTPTLHAYPDHVFLVVHSPLMGEAGHVHLLELDLVIGPDYLVTVHGPINPRLDPALALAETDGLLRRIRRGTARASSPYELAHSLGSSIARTQRGLVTLVAEKLPDLEQRVMAGDFREPELLLEEMFLVRHELITARTMAAQTHDVFARLSTMEVHVVEEQRRVARDLADQFGRIRSVADGESQFLFGVIDLYQTRVTTKMTLAMERLAVIAAVTLPVTALASIYGMNVIIFDSTNWVQLGLVVAVMLAMSALLLRWARKQGWW